MRVSLKKREQKNRPKKEKAPHLLTTDNSQKRTKKEREIREKEKEKEKDLRSERRPEMFTLITSSSLSLSSSLNSSSLLSRRRRRRNYDFSHHHHRVKTTASSSFSPASSSFVVSSFAVNGCKTKHFRRRGQTTVIVRNSASNAPPTPTKSTSGGALLEDVLNKMYFPAKNFIGKYQTMFKFLGVFLCCAMADVTFLAMFGSQTASSVKAGMEWTRWVGTPLSAFGRAAAASALAGYASSVWKKDHAFSSNTMHSYALACATYAMASILVVVVVQAGKVSYGLASPWQLVGAIGGIAAVTGLFTAVAFVQNVMRSAAKAGRDSLNNEALSASVDFASAVGTIKKAMAREFEKEMTRSVEKIEKEMRKALEEKKRAEEKLAKIINERSAEMQKMNARIDQVIEEKASGREQGATEALESSSSSQKMKAENEEEMKSLREEMARMRATYESAMNAAQREFTEALEKERNLSAEKIESWEKEHPTTPPPDVSSSSSEPEGGMMSEEDVVAMVSKLQEEKDREIQKVVQALLSENLAREASLRYDNKVQKATSESALVTAQNQIEIELSAYRAQIESYEQRSKFQAAERDALYRLQSHEFAKTSKRDREYTKAEAEDAIKVLYDVIADLKEEQLDIVAALQAENVDAIAEVLHERDAAVSAIEKELKTMKATYESSLAAAQENFKAASATSSAVDAEASKMLEDARKELIMAKAERNALYKTLQSEFRKDKDSKTEDEANAKVAALEARIEALTKYSTNDKRALRDLFLSEVAKAKKIGSEQTKPIEEALRMAKAERDALYRLVQRESLKLNHQTEMAASDLESWERELESIGAELRTKTATLESALNASQQSLTQTASEWSLRQKDIAESLEKANKSLEMAKSERNALYRLATNESMKNSERLSKVNAVDGRFTAEMERLQGELLAMKNNSAQKDEKTKAQMDDLKKQNESDVLLAKRETEKAREDVKQQIAAIEQKHAKELENAKESAKNADAILVAKVARVQQETEALKKQQQENVKKLEEQHKKALEEAKDASNSSSAILVENVAAVQKQINDSKDAQKLEMEKMIQTKDALVKDKEQLSKAVQQLEADAEKMKEVISRHGEELTQAKKQSVQDVRKELQDAMEKAKKTASMIEKIKNDSEGRIVEARRAAIAEYEKLAMEEARIAREAFTKEINATTEELERRAKQFVEAEKILKESSEAKKYLRDVLKEDEEKLSKLPKWLR